MLILHGSVLGETLFLWGESPPSNTPATAPRRKTRAAVSVLPTGPDDKTLLAALSQWAISDTSPRQVWLPSLVDRPAPSHPLVGDFPDAQTSLTMRAWTVQTCELSIRTAVDVLAEMSKQALLKPGVMVGSTLQSWGIVLRFAASLTARQQFLPGVRKKAGEWIACWKSVRVGADLANFATLAQAMPQAARALATGDTAPETPAETVLGTFVDVIVDHLVREIGPAVVVKPVKSGKKKTPKFASVHDQWLHALRSTDGVMTGDDSELTGLADQVRDWHRPITVIARSPYRLCFRLEEPEGEPAKGEFAPPGDWRVRYFLQPNDEPSLLVPLDQVWKNKHNKPAVWQRGKSDAREYVLAALGQAATLVPAVNATLKSTEPTGYTLNTAHAHDFLTDKAVSLEQAGFPVLLPAWWTRRGTKQRLTMKTRASVSGGTSFSGLSMDQIVRFDWQAALGEQTLTQKELEALAKLKLPLVKVRGQWVQLSPEEIQAAIEFWKKQARNEGTVRDLVRLALGADTLPEGVRLSDVEGEGAVGELLRQLEGKEAFAEEVVPATFHGELRPYQVRGYSWLAFLRRFGLGACLADDMGLGKTVQTLALIEQNWRAAPGPTLLICPTSVIGNWQREAARFTPELPVLVHHGGTRKQGESFKALAGKHGLVLSSYALLHRDAELFKSIPWKAVVLDEAQNIKNPSTKQAQAARGLPGAARIALTGTPVENHVGDLWSIMEFLNPGFLGTQAAFRRNFYLPIQAYRDTDAEKRLKRLTGPFVLRRLKTDKTIIDDLPDKIETKVFCTLTQEQASLYQAVVDEANKSLETKQGIERRGTILSVLMRLKQVCNHPAQFLGDNSAIDDRSGKLRRLMELLEEVTEAGDKALLFTQFTEMAVMLVDYLQDNLGQEVLYLHGGMTKKQRDAVVSRFQSVDGPGLFVLSLKAGGTGLNLTQASHVFHFDRWWNPAVENQATDRAFRIGQKKNVQVHKFVCQGTVEERIDDMIERKREIAGRTVGTGENWLTELSTADLRQLWALSKSALGD